MATHLRLKTNDIDLIHLDIKINAYTLCGLDTISDGNNGNSDYLINKVTNRKVNCPDCLTIVGFCKKVKAKELKKINQ